MCGAHDGVAWVLCANGCRDPPAAPFAYVWGQAHHVLAEMHNQGSGYLSLCEGRNGRIYIGTAKYGESAYLVEFDPKTGQQRIVIDTNEVCRLDPAGWNAAQSKIHTRNFVGPSGKIYVGTMGIPEGLAQRLGRTERHRCHAGIQVKDRRSVPGRFCDQLSPADHDDDLTQNMVADRSAMYGGIPLSCEDLPGKLLEIVPTNPNA